MGEVRRLGSRFRALVADRLQTNRLLLQEMLAQEGYITVQVADGDEALEVLETGAFDLVVLEAELPVQDGVTVLKALNTMRVMSADRRPLPPAILMASDAATVRALQQERYAPKFATLAHPLRTQPLRAAIHEATEARASAA